MEWNIHVIYRSNRNCRDSLDVWKPLLRCPVSRLPPARQALQAYQYCSNDRVLGPDKCAGLPARGQGLVRGGSTGPTSPPARPHMRGYTAGPRISPRWLALWPFPCLTRALSVDMNCSGRYELNFYVQKTTYMNKHGAQPPSASGAGEQTPPGFNGTCIIVVPSTGCNMGIMRPSSPFPLVTAARADPESGRSARRPGGRRVGTREQQQQQEDRVMSTTFTNTDRRQQEFSQPGEVG